MVWIKICGITNKKDALDAAALGADALGLVFADSPRRIEPETARQIIRALPAGIEKIGVFVNEGRAQVAEIAEYCGLTGLQFHGEETPQYCGCFQRYQVIKALRVREQPGKDSVELLVRNGGVKKILLDTYVPQQRGGTGKTFPWEIAAQSAWGGVPVIIAGGLTPENVKIAVEIAKPFGIDVSSGVEKEPGIKDLRKLTCFMQKAREG